MARIRNFEELIYQKMRQSPNRDSTWQRELDIVLRGYVPGTKGPVHDVIAEYLKEYNINPNSLIRGHRDFDETVVTRLSYDMGSIFQEYSRWERRNIDQTYQSSNLNLPDEIQNREHNRYYQV